MNILVIEDEPRDRKLAAVVLETSGHVVQERTSAEEALEAIDSVRPDLILVDVRLPGITGLELVRQLKANPATLGIPVVVMTAFPEIFEQQEMLAAGCNAYLVKPLDTRTLAERIEAAAVKPDSE
jgi:two-component system cell cycle response regulator